MKISIITVSYNSASTIYDTLQSVFSQTYTNIEHIVIDGGSTDSTLDIIKNNGDRVAQLVSERDGGIYDAMNKGLNLATGEVIGFLNSDDYLASSDSIALIAEALARDSIDAAYGDLVFVDAKNTNRVVRLWRPGPHIAGSCTKGWMAPHPTFYARRAVVLRAGGFDLRYKLQSDFDLMLRLFEIEGIEAMYIPKTLVRMRMGGATTGSFRNIIKGNVEAANSCKSHGYPGGISFVARKLASRVPQFLWRNGI